MVDDEPSLCQVVIDILAMQGLHGIAAPDGDTALRILADSKTEPLIVLSDVLMPGMDGLTLARKLKPLLKRATIVLMSGHLSDTSWWPAELRGLTFLAKPFNSDALLALTHTARLDYDRAI